MAEPNAASGGDAAAAAVAPEHQPDPLRPSARRVVLLILGAALCLLAFAAGFAGGLLPIWWREHRRDVYYERAMAQDPALDFASADWLETTLWQVPELPGSDIPNYAGAALWIALAIAPFILVAAHILITWFAASLALRADRRLDLGLGRRPALALAAAVMVRLLFTRLPLVTLVCGLVAGLSYLGNLQQSRLFFPRLTWAPMTGAAAAACAVLVFDLFMSIGAVRRKLQQFAPVESRICNSCGYSLRGLPPNVSACPECGRALLGNLTVVSMMLSPAVGRSARRVAVALLAILTLAIGVSLAYSKASRDLLGAWVSARGEAVTFGPASIANVQAPDGAVLKVSDGASAAYFTARSREGPFKEWTLRGRALEPDGSGGIRRIEYFGPVMGMQTQAGLMSRPAQVPYLYPSRAGVFATWVSTVPGKRLSVTFSGSEDLSQADRAWLAEKLSTAGAFDEPRGVRTVETRSGSDGDE